MFYPLFVLEYFYEALSFYPPETDVFGKYRYGNEMTRYRHKVWDSDKSITHQQLNVTKVLSLVILLYHAEVYSDLVF